MRPITIHVSCDKTHNSPWEVYQYVAGKKIRLGRTKTKKEAVAKAAAYQEQINRRGTETVTLTVAQIDEYLRAKAALGDRSLDEVVKLFLSAGQRPSVSLKKAAADFMSAIEARGLQDCSVRDYRGKIDFLVSTYPDQTVEFFASPPGESGQPFVDFVMNASSNNQTRKHYRTKLGTFLRWCETRNWISKHPGVWVEIGQVQRDPPAVYTPDDTAKLLDGFERLCPRLVPFITLQAFGALRPFEAMRQTAERLYFEEKKLLISHHKRGADPTQTRTVEDPPETLWTWLSPLRGASGLIDSRDCYQQIDRICADTGVTWIADGLRHSCLSYWAKLNGHDAGADLAGHERGSYTLSRFYKAVVTKDDSRAYFALFPKK